MSDTPEQNIPVGEAQAPVGGDDVAALRNDLELLRANNQKLIKEKGKANDSVKDLQRQIAELQQEHHKAGQARLVKNQEFETLWKDASATNSSLQERIVQLEQQLEEKDVAFQQQQIKATALNAISQSGIVNPDQAFALLKDNLRLKDGQPIALAGGVEVDLASHLESLKAPGSGWEHHFAGTGARGMSAVGSSPNTAGGKSWSAMSLTEQIAMLNDDPDSAARLQAQG